MTTAELVAVVLLLAMAAYACGGGADFGAGFWDLTAGDADQGSTPRAAIDDAMAPVWEANNVWLVFVLVITWTGFPALFEAVMSTAWIPVSLAALGIVLRGAAFAIGKPTRQAVRRRRLTLIFGLASVVTPFLLAAVLGGVASGRIPTGNAAGDPVTSWLNPTSVLFGVLALVGAAFIGGVFLAADVRRFGEVDLQRYFERRAATSAGVLLVTALVGLLVLHEDAPTLLDGLQRGWGLLFAVVATVGLVVTGVLEHLGRIKGTRLTAIVAVASLVLAWGFAQNPYLLPKTLTVAQGAGDPDTLRWLVIVTVVAVVLVGPALALLYRLDLTDRLTPDDDEDLMQAQASRGD